MSDPYTYTDSPLPRMTEWSVEGLWNHIVGAVRSSLDVRDEAAEAGQTVEQWMQEAITRARPQGLDDPRDDDEILATLIRAMDSQII